VIAMDDDNLRQLVRMAGDRATPVIRLLRSFDPSAPVGAEVPDPYSGGTAGFDHVLDLCERACAGLLDHVRVARTELEETTGATEPVTRIDSETIPIGSATKS
jgi:protein-tyrosine phosphatase